MTLKEECSGHKTCYNCREKGHISPDCPKPDKRKKDNKSKHRHDSSDDEEDEKKNKNKKLGKKKSHDKKTKLFPKKKGHTKRSFLVEKQEWVTDVSSSEEEEDIVTIALTNEEPSLPPPPMCLMAKGNSRYVRVKMIVMMSLTLMSLLTSLMSIHPSSRGKMAKSKFLRALVPS